MIIFRIIKSLFFRDNSENTVKVGHKKEKNFLKFAKLPKISIDEVLEIGEDLRYNFIFSQKIFEEIEKVTNFIAI